MNKFSVIDFFCGAGGFSEGFRQMGYKIVYGYDNWRPAIDTYNYNFNLNCQPTDILKFKFSVEEIEKIPNTDIIIGSPPCVSFSSSNKSGKADKTHGVELTKTFFRIIAVKKHMNKSKLKAWFMENVANSKHHLKEKYTFKDLDLEKWAKKNKINPNKTAIDLYENTAVINSADYGSFQVRKRLIIGEIIKLNKLVIPDTTHDELGTNNKDKYLTVSMMKKKFPHPFCKLSKKIIKDPQYPLSISQRYLTDHFYDTGIYKVDWMYSIFQKTNHPYMGKMAFPENENKPSRTVTATSIANSRESIIYESELKRKGNGEYRLPTVREAAILMGFPINYQFIGFEKSKWKLVGNAVCCSVSRAFAKFVLEQYNIKQGNYQILIHKKNNDFLNNLNTYAHKKFDNPPQKNIDSRFRRHAIKDGNITVTLSNFDIKKNSKKSVNKWHTSVQYGTGKNIPIQNIRNNYFKSIESEIKVYKSGKDFLTYINNGFSEKIADAKQLQKLYIEQKTTNKYLPPNELVDLVRDKIEELEIDDYMIIQKKKIIFKFKNRIPLRQLFALYAINKISTVANQKKECQ